MRRMSDESRILVILLSMVFVAIAAIALAGWALGCERPPYYPNDFSGTTCTPENQQIQCRCSECFTFDTSSISSISRFEVRRYLASDPRSWAIVATLPCIEAHVDLEGEFHTKWCPGAYCMAKDCQGGPCTSPRAGTLYRYTVTAIGPTGLRSAESAGVLYRAAPLDCIEGGLFVACYVGDTLRTR